MKLAQDIIIKPIITEASMMAAQERKYTFKVADGANKIEIKKACEELSEVRKEDRVCPKAAQLLGRKRLSPLRKIPKQSNSSTDLCN